MAPSKHPNDFTRSHLRWALMICICCNGLSYGFNRHILVPIQDQLMDWYTINAVEYQLLQTLYAWPNMLCSILCGILIDKFSVHKIFCISWIVTLIGAIFLFSSSFPRDYVLLCIARTLSGIGNEGMSICIKLYVIHFFAPREYSIVFGVCEAFHSAGSGLNSLFTYRVYQCFDIHHSLAVPLVLGPVVSIPLLIVMFLEAYHWKTSNTESTTLITTNQHSTDRQRFNLKQIQVRCKRMRRAF